MDNWGKVQSGCLRITSVWKQHSQTTRELEGSNDTVPLGRVFTRDDCGRA